MAFLLRVLPLELRGPTEYMVQESLECFVATIMILDVVPLPDDLLVVKRSPGHPEATVRVRGGYIVNTIESEGLRSKGALTIEAGVTGAWKGPGYSCFYVEETDWIKFYGKD